MRTVAEATGIKPDHFMMADFNAVKTLTTAVDGVDVCVEKAVDDPKSHLKLPAGESKVEGEQALAFVRTRHAFGNEGDLDRIKVQQQFLGSLMRKMASGDTLTSPTKLVKLAEAATKALTVDKPIGNVGTLKDIALELKKVPTKNITFMTVPVIDNPAEPKPVTVVLKPGTAEQVFSTIRNDISFTEVEKKEKAAKKKEAAAVAARLEGEKSDPSEVRVRILNGGAPAGSAQQELNYLQTTAGVTKSENAGNAQAEAAKTTLEYAPDQADQARALAEILGLSGAAMKPGESVTNAQGLPTMTLTLGKDFKGPGSSSTPRPWRRRTWTRRRPTRSCAPVDLTGPPYVSQGGDGPAPRRGGGEGRGDDAEQCAGERAGEDARQGAPDGPEAAERAEAAEGPRPPSTGPVTRTAAEAGSATRPADAARAGAVGPAGCCAGRR